MATDVDLCLDLGELNSEITVLNSTINDLSATVVELNTELAALEETVIQIDTRLSQLELSGLLTLQIKGLF